MFHQPPKPGETLAMQVGNKTECALLGFVSNLGGNYDAIRQEFPEERLKKVGGVLLTF